MCSSTSAGNFPSLRGRRRAAQRPASAMPNSGVRRRRSWRLRWVAGISRARRPAKLSAFTRPTATSSPRAFSSSVRSRWVSAVSSSKNSAPCSFRVSSTLAAFDDSSGSAASATSMLHCASWRRGSRTMGVLRSGPLPLRPRVVVRDGNRAQTSRPARHRSSSQSIP
ncbi:hypothetical protein D9M68_408890 [compost metagenome]